MTQSDPIARFDGKTISYTYDNGWDFTNTFEGNIRVTVSPRRGELREPVQIREVRQTSSLFRGSMERWDCLRRSSI